LKVAAVVDLPHVYTLRQSIESAGSSGLQSVNLEHSAFANACKTASG
jgi:hypothetical protein